MYNVGIIGVGIMGQRMMNAMSAHPDFNIARIWDLNQELIERTSMRYPDPVPVSDADSLLHESLDLVYIATPPSTHVDYARRALDKNIAIFCEKPLAIDIRESQQLVKDVQAGGISNAINFPFASDLNIRTLEEEVRSGLHGEPERVEIRFHFNAWPRTWQRGAASWLAGRAEGGFLREVFSHFVYLTHRVLGPMKLENARVTFPNDTNVAEIKAWAQFIANGVPVNMWGAVGGAAPDFNEWTLYGSERSYRIQDWGQLKVANTNRWYDMMPRGEPKPPLFHQLDNLSNMIRSEDHTLPSFEDGLRVQEIVEELLDQSD